LFGQLSSPEIDLEYLRHRKSKMSQAQKFNKGLFFISNKKIKFLLVIHKYLSSSQSVNNLFIFLNLISHP